jgi:single-strand DNA-binding protein
MDSTVTLVGNITRDPELRFTTGGRAVANFGVAVNRRYMINNEWQEDVSFIDVVAWAQLGENAAASFKKGDRVIVAGRINQRSWEADDGSKRSKVDVVADALGAELRFATVEIAKTDRSTASAERAPESAYGSDEEPF